MKVRVPRPGRAVIVTGLLGVFVGAATLALARRLFRTTARDRR